MWGVSSDPGAVSVKLPQSQTGSQTPEFSRGKKTKYKVFRRKGNSFSIKLKFESGPSCCWGKVQQFSSAKKSISQIANLLENWAEVTVGSKNFFLLPLATLLPSTQLPHSLPTHPPLPSNGAVSASCACLLLPPLPTRGGVRPYLPEGEAPLPTRGGVRAIPSLTPS